MYTRLSERVGWNMEVIDIKQSEQGGLKEVVAKLEGKGVFKVLNSFRDVPSGVLLIHKAIYL